MIRLYLSAIFLFAKTLVGLANPLISPSSDSTLLILPNSSISILGGIKGLGMELNYGIFSTSRLFLLAGISFIGYSKQNTFAYNSRSLIKINPDFRLGLVYAGMQYLPFKKHSFYATAGLGYTYNAKMAIKANTDTGLDISGTFISAEDFGKINVEIKWNKVVPFVGIGVGRAIPKKRFGLGAELGLNYIGSPELTMDYTGILEITNIDEVLPRIEKNIAGYAFLPYLIVKLTYGFYVGQK